jgi:Tol biopolymer transport system component
MIHVPRVALVTLLAGLPALGSPQVTWRASVDSAGVQGDASSAAARVSADGRFVVFRSSATNLVPGDTNGLPDIFVRDRASDATTRVSVDSAGLQGNAGCNRSSISSDGRFVVFETAATNLVAGDTNGTTDIFRHDRQTGQTIRVSLTSAGGQANALCEAPDVSDDGRYVVFHSSATNLVVGDSNVSRDVFLRDVQLGTTARVSTTTGGQEVFGNSDHPRISAGGGHVVFYSFADALVPGDTNNTADIFTKDLLSGATDRVSVSSSGAQSDGLSLTPDVSGDGRYVVFHGSATNLVTGDANAADDVFVRDTWSGLTTRISVSSGGAPSNGSSTDATISADGRFVAFQSLATNLVAGDTNAKGDVFRHDRLTGQTLRVSVGPAGAQAVAACSLGAISGDGLHVAFESTAANLVAGDTNGSADVFVREVGIAANVTSYCTAGTSTNGCAASLSASGTPSIVAPSGFVLSCSGVEGQKTGLLFYGIDGAAASPWAPSSTSFLCVKPPTQRTPSQSSGGTSNACDGVLALDFTAWIAANPGALGTPLVAGDTLFSQAWYRDPAAPKTTNLSDGLAFTMVP